MDDFQGIYISFVVDVFSDNIEDDFVFEYILSLEREQFLQVVEGILKFSFVEGRFMVYVFIGEFDDIEGFFCSFSGVIVEVDNELEVVEFCVKCKMSDVMYKVLKIDVCEGYLQLVLVCL